MDQIASIMENLKVLSLRWTGNRRTPLSNVFLQVRNFDNELENRIQAIRNSTHHNRAWDLIRGLHGQHIAKLRLSNYLKAHREMLSQYNHESEQWEEMLRDAEREYARLRRSQ